jgi:calcineurin-like phosphoesterase family protein
MRTFFTSDLHFGHANIIRFCERPYASVEEMDAALINNWNARVHAHDVVWVLGDVSFHHPQQTFEILSQLKGFKKLVLGNHDKSIRKQKHLYDCFTEVYDGFKEVYLQDEEVHTPLFAVLCHYPMLSWNRSFHGSLHLHGHMHNRQPIKDGETMKRLDVGVDAHQYRPITLQEVIDHLATITPDGKKEY